MPTQEVNGKPARAGSPAIITNSNEASFGFHPSQHLPFCGVKLSLAPLARFFEVLMTTKIRENSSLLTLLLEPAKGTLEGLAFFDPDAGHPVNRLLTNVEVIESALPRGIGQHPANTKKIPRGREFVKFNTNYINTIGCVL